MIERILVVGDVPPRPAGERYDGLEIIGIEGLALPDDTWHLEREPRHAPHLDELHDMPRFAASVSMHDVYYVLNKADALFIFERAARWYMPDFWAAKRQQGINDLRDQADREHIPHQLLTGYADARRVAQELRADRTYSISKATGGR